MAETPTQKTEPPRASTLARPIVTAYYRVVQLIPPKARLAALTGSLVLVGLAVYTALSGGSSTLNLICRHDLQSADISVSIDGRTTYIDHISETPKKLFTVLVKRGETFSKSLTVPSGQHVVQVHLSSTADGFDQTKQSELNLLPGNEATLVVAAARNGMTLEYRGSVAAPIKNGGPAYSDTLRSMLITLIGSAASAVIGFVVQEFLRSKKAA